MFDEKNTSKVICETQNIVFITPNLEPGVGEESVGTLILANILRNQGLHVDVLSFHSFDYASGFEIFVRNAVTVVCEKKPCIVSFYTRCDTYHIMVRLAKILKKQCGCYIVFGGPQAAMVAEQTVKLIEEVDYVCCGEGETTVYPFFSSLLRGTPDTTLPGIVFRRKHEIIKNALPPLIDNLDEIPLFDYSSYNVKISDAKPFGIEVGRGCPFHCTFCSTSVFWNRKYRLKSPERIVREVQTLHRQYGVTYFSFIHDMFTMNREHVLKVCRLLDEMDLHIHWKCSARVDCIDRHMIDIMCHSGMKHIFFGIESGSPRMQKLINKNLDLQKAIEIIAYAKKQNVRVTVSFIYGFPEENEADVSATIRMIYELVNQGIFDIQVHLCTFLPGTELTQKYSNKLIREEWRTDFVDDFGTKECEDLISSYPSLFPHYRGVDTGLRKRVQFFSHFIYVWLRYHPVYQYLAAKYEKDSLFDMYADFVNANRQTLQQNADLPFVQQLALLIEHDQFIDDFKQDANFDLICDYYRMERIKSAFIQKKTEESTIALFCFSPKEMMLKKRIEEYSRQNVIAVFQRKDDAQLHIRIRAIKPEKHKS